MRSRASFDARRREIERRFARVEGLARAERGQRRPANIGSQPRTRSADAQPVASTPQRSPRDVEARSRPAQVALVCPHFPPCAGCPQIPVEYAAQLVAKRVALQEALAPLGATPDVVHDTVPSPVLRGYRNQARLVFRRMSRGGSLHIGLGMYLPGTHRVVHIPNCPIQPERLNAIAASATRFAEELDLSVYDERTGEGALRYLALRCDRARAHAIVTIIVAEDCGEPLRVLARALHQRHPEIVGISLHVNARHSNVLFAGEDAWVIGEDRLEDRVGRFRILVSPRSFLQVNHAQAEWIYGRLAARLGGAAAVAGEGAEAMPIAGEGEDAAAETPGTTEAGEAPREIVLDLYSGVGGIALHLVRPGRLVVGVEDSTEAVEDARRAADRNGVRGVRFVAARVEAFLRDPAAFGVDLAAAPVRAAVLNPPRAGCKPGVMEALRELAVPELAYVSCRPLSLVRDLEALGRGYGIVEATPVDMIPLTPHIESLVFLRRT